MRNRFVVGEKRSQVNLAQAVVLAEFGDVVVVRTEREKSLGEALARRSKPATRIDFIVNPNVNSETGRGLMARLPFPRGIKASRLAAGAPLTGSAQELFAEEAPNPTSPLLNREQPEKTSAEENARLSM